MAKIMYCPNCKTARECTKKGFNKNGEQLYYCKECKKKFPEVEGQLPVKAKTAKEKKSKITEIYVNNNLIKTVDKKITVDEAFNLLTNYFADIAKDSVEVKEGDNKTVIKFAIKLIGTKG